MIKFRQRAAFCITLFATLLLSKVVEPFRTNGRFAPLPTSSQRPFRRERCQKNNKIRLRSRENLALNLLNHGPLVCDTYHKQSSTKRLTRKIRFVLFSVLCYLAILKSSPAAAVVTLSKSTGAAALPAEIGARQLSLAAVLVLLTGSWSLSYFWRVQDIAASLLKACLRCTAQLYLAGGFLLTQIMSTTQPALVVGWIVLTGLIAAQEASSRVEYTYPKLSQHLAISLLAGGGLVLSFASFTKLFVADPWFAPRTWIPVAGMLFGNTLTAMSLTASTLTKELMGNKEQVEARLSRGATWREATRKPLQRTLLAALTPIINALTVTGVVHIPGMMTGQILSGQAPYQAAAYQVLIFFLIASTTCTTVQLLARLMLREFISKTDHRLCLNCMTPLSESKKNESVYQIFLSMTKAIPNMIRRDKTSDGNTGRIGRNFAIVSDGPFIDGTIEKTATFEARDVKIERAGVKFSISIQKGERVGLAGASGSGKTQLLRSLVGLEEVDTGLLSLNGATAAQLGMPLWRKKVALSLQNPSTFDGTPREVLKELSGYQGKLTDAFMKVESSFETFALEWGLATSTLNQPWGTLSGGEMQRIQLAIILSLDPEILLLDEATSGLDEATELKVEATLKRLGFSILMISHSKSQLERFCTRSISLPQNVIESKVLP